MAYTYESKTEALEAAEQAGVPTSMVARDHESGLYGWTDDNDEPTQESQGGALVVVQQGAADAGSADNTDAKPQPGDVRLMIGEPITEARAKGLIEQLAKKLGFTIVAVDATTGEERFRYTKAEAKSAGGKAGSSIIRDERGLTQSQAAALDLMLRPEGATNKELLAAGASEGKAVNWEYMQHCITRASKGRFGKTTFVPRAEGNGVTKGFRMVEIPESERAQVLYDVEVHMVARKQLKAVVAPKPQAHDEHVKLAAD